MRAISVLKNQSLFDIAIKEYGSVYAVTWLLEDNPTLKSIVDNVYEGDELLIRDQKHNAQVQLYLSPYKIATLPSTGRADGIGFMKVETDFLVS